MILIGYTIMGLGFLILSQVNSVWQFYAGFIVVTLGSGLGGWLAIIALVNNWFIRRRSFALASAMSGIHLGGFLVPVLALGLQSHGFRTTSLGIGVFLLVLVFPVTRAIRNRPEDYGLRPDGDPPPSQASRSERPAMLPEDEAEFTVAQALRTRAFWILTIVHLSSSVSIVTLALHLVPKLTDMGLSLSGAGMVVLTYTAIALPSQFVAGWFADKFPKPPVIFVFLMLQAGSILIIAIAETLPMVFLFAVLYGIGFGGRIPLLTAIRGDYFGRKAFATIMGLSQFPNNIAMIGAPLFAGYMFDVRGSYFIPFSTFAALNLVGAVLMLFVRRPRIAQPSPLVASQQPVDD
jgi:MFS family permease